MRRFSWLGLVVFVGCAGRDSSLAPTGERSPAISQNGVVQLGGAPPTAFRTEDGAYLIDRGAHALRVETNGDWSFRPARTFDWAGAHAAPAPLRLARSKIERGSAGSQVARVREGDQGTEIAIDRGIAVERLAHVSRGVEQSWTFAAKPGDAPEIQTGGVAAPSDLVVRVPVSGYELVEATADGVTFRDPGTKRIVRYGAATWIDADDQRTSVRPHWEGGEVVMTVPGSVVEASRYPAQLDPIVSGPIAVDGQVGNIAAGPTVAYDPAHDMYMVVWQETTNLGNVSAYAQRVSGSGTPQGSNVLLPPVINAPYTTPPSVAFDGTYFQILWQSDVSTIMGRRMDSTGTWIDNAPVTIINSVAQKSGPITAAANSQGNLLVTYSENGTAGIFVQGGGAVGSELVIETSGATGCGPSNQDWEGGPAVASDGTNFLVAHQHGCQGSSGVAARTVSNVGAIGSLLMLANHYPPDPPKIAYANGSYLVVWEDNRRGNPNTDVYGNLITGGVAGPLNGFAIYAPGDGTNSYSPSITFDGGNYLVTFINSQFSVGTEGPIKSQQVHYDGTLFGGVYAGWPGPVNMQIGSASRGNGKSLVAYQLNSTNLEAAVTYTSGMDGAPCVTNSDCDHGNCIANVPAGTGSSCCSTVCTPSDSCHVAQCSTGICTNTAISSGTCGTYSACQAVAAGCSAPADGDGDNLPDIWENSNNGHGQHYVDLNCNGVWDGPSEPLLPGANPGRADVYVTYDYMDYGMDDWSCATAADCTALGGAHRGESCVSGKCAYVCATNLDCTDGTHNTCTTNADCGAGSYCDSVNTHQCQRGAWHAAEQCRSWSGGNACFHTHDPEAIAPGALQKVIDSYNSHNVTLHITRGVAQPHSHVISYRADGAMDTLCEGASGVNVGVGKYAVSFYDLKALSFPSNSKEFMHYAVFAHYVGCDTSTHCTPVSLGGTSDCPFATNPDSTPKNIPAQGMSGLAEVEGNDLVVALGGLVNDQAFLPGIVSQAGHSTTGAAFMHELGHNLGLRHDGHVDKPCPGGLGCTGGDTCVDLGDGEGQVCHQMTGGMAGVEQPNYKPNFVSLMNYRYELNGIQNANTLNTAAAGNGPTMGSNTVDPTLTRLDYSNQILPTGGPTPGALTENNLSDTAGLGAPVDSLFPGQQLLFTYKDGNCDVPWRTAPAEGSVDWMTYNVTYNATGQTADVDANVGAGVCANAPADALNGRQDWGNFVYAFQCTSPFADGVAPVANYPAEPDVPALSGDTRGQTCGQVGCLGPAPPAAANPSCSSGQGCGSPIPAKVDIRAQAQNNWVMATDSVQVSGAATINYTGGGCAVCGGGYQCFANNSSNFTDPSPPSSVVTGVAIQLQGVDCTNGGAVKVYMNGYLLGTTSVANDCVCGQCQTYPWVVYYNGNVPMAGWVQGGTNTLSISTSNGASTCLHDALVYTYYWRGVPVTVYGSPVLDVSSINSNTMTFGNALPVLPVVTSADLDGDGYKDLQAMFLGSSTGLANTATSATVSGTVNLPLGGTMAFAGSDVVQVVNSPQVSVACSAQGYSGQNGCWYKGALGANCNTTCTGHNGFNSAGSTHSGNYIGKGFYPLKTNGSNWVTVECSSVDNNTDWGATGAAADGTFSHPACYLSCSCQN